MTDIKPNASKQHSPPKKNVVPGVLAASVAVAPATVGAPVSSIPGSMPGFVATLTSEGIQRILEENQQLIFAIIESTNSGRVRDSVHYHARLQQNLLFLTTMAENEAQSLRFIQALYTNPNDVKIGNESGGMKQKTDSKISMGIHGENKTNNGGNSNISNTNSNDNNINTNKPSTVPNVNGNKATNNIGNVGKAGAPGNTTNRIIPPKSSPMSKLGTLMQPPKGMELVPNPMVSLNSNGNNSNQDPNSNGQNNEASQGQLDEKKEVKFWTEQEKAIFEQGCKEHLMSDGRPNFKLIAEIMRTRTTAQVRSYYQKQQAKKRKRMSEEAGPAGSQSQTGQ